MADKAKVSVTVDRTLLRESIGWRAR